MFDIMLNSNGTGTVKLDGKEITKVTNVEIIGSVGNPPVIKITCEGGLTIKSTGGKLWINGMIQDRSEKE